MYAQNPLHPPRKSFSMPDSTKAEKAYQLYTEENLTQEQVGERLDCSQQWARELIEAHKGALAQHEDGRKKGIEEGARSMKSKMEDSLEDRLSGDDEYDCSECGASVDYLSPKCGSCGEALNWGAVQ